jgi:hypothetical protein
VRPGEWGSDLRYIALRRAGAGVVLHVTGGGGLGGLHGGRGVEGGVWCDMGEMKRGRRVAREGTVVALRTPCRLPRCWTGINSARPSRKDVAIVACTSRHTERTPHPIHPSRTPTSIASAPMANSEPHINIEPC